MNEEVSASLADPMIRRAIAVEKENAGSLMLRTTLMAVSFSAAIATVAYYFLSPQMLLNPFLTITPIAVPAAITFALSLVEHTTLRRLAHEHHALKHEMARREAVEKELARLALTDDLTKLANRRQFGVIAKNAFARSKRYARSVALVVFDIDHFKKVNDTYGHDIGDDVLVEVADCARKAVRDSDTVCRMGGEEFAVLLEEADADAAALVAERIRTFIENAAVTGPAGTVAVTASVGIAMVDPKTDSISETMKLADARLYEAKEQGRNRVVAGTT